VPHEWGTLHPHLIQALLAHGFTHPTEIQKLAKAAVFSKKDVLLHGQTGCGKTLAYLLPLLHRMKRNEEVSGDSRARPKQPRMIILVPTRELGVQVLGVAKSLTHQGKFSCMSLLGGGKLRDQKKSLETGYDVVVATPSRLMQAARIGALKYKDVRALVIDEADTMLTQGFEEDVHAIVRALRGAENVAVTAQKQAILCQTLGQALIPEEQVLLKSEVQLLVVMAAASLPRPVHRLIQHNFPDMDVAKASGAHRPPEGVSQEFVEVLPTNQQEVILEVLRGAMARERGEGKVIIFCNTTQSCAFVHNVLETEGIPHSSTHGDLRKDARVQHLADFVEGSNSILVCTDICARGLDVPAVRTVINFDMPMNSVDYLHRVGRTARNGAKGWAISLVRKKDKVLVEGIRLANQHGTSLEAISANREAYPLQRIPSLRLRSADARLKYAPRPSVPRTSSLARGGVKAKAGGRKKKFWFNGPATGK